MKLFKDRTAGFYVGFAGAAAMLVADIVFVIADHADITFSVVTFLFVLIGALAEGLVLFKDYKFAPMLPAACFAVALGMHLYLALPTLSDVVNEVNFVGGNATAAVAFAVIFALGTAAACVACFTDQSKTDPL